jgi:hypothetical protein
MRKFVLVLLVLTISASTFSQPQTLTPVKVNGQWGYSDKKGKLVVPAKFDIAKPFKGNFGLVGLRDLNIPYERGELAYRWGFVDLSGRVVVEPKYNHVRDFSDGLAAVAILTSQKMPSIRVRANDDLLWGFVDLAGQLVIPTQFKKVGDFSEGLAVVNVDASDKGMCPRRGKFGYIDKTGKFAIEPKFGAAMDFREGKARVGIGIVEYLGRCLCCAPRFTGEWGYVDKQGNYVPDKK